MTLVHRARRICFVAAVLLPAACPVLRPQTNNHKNAYTSPPAPQAAVPLSPSPAGSGPSLAATMLYIEQKLSGLGRVSFVMPVHNLSQGSDGRVPWVWEYTNVIASASSCQIYIHEKGTVDGNVVVDKDYVVGLKDARDVIVEPMEQYVNKVNATAGNMNAVAGAPTPAVLALTVRGQGTGSHTFDFADADMAGRAARAFTHAIELCGGGSKELF